MKTIGVALFDCSFAICVPTSDVASQMLSLLPRNCVAISVDQATKHFTLEKTDFGTVTPSYLVSDDAGFLQSCHSLSLARDVLKTQIELHLAQSCRRYTFVHAGVVRFEGATIVIPGESFSGKTSLVAQLVKAGGSYLSDEYALLDRDGNVHPYLRSLAVRSGCNKTYVPAETVGRIESRHQSVHVVLLTRYIAGATWRPQSITRARAAMEVFQNTLPAIERPRYTLDTIRAAVSHAQCVRGSRGDAQQVVEWLRSEQRGSGKIAA